MPEVTPDPKTVREIARRIILEATTEHGPGFYGPRIGGAVRQEAGTGLRMHEYSSWFAAVDAQVETAQITVSWPDEQPQDEPCPCGCEDGPDDCTCGGACRCGKDCLVCEPGAIARAAVEQPQDERDAALAEVTAELESANAHAAEIAKQRSEYREEIMRLRAQVRELKAAQPERDGDVRAVALGAEITTTERITSLLYDLDVRTKERDEARELARVSLDILRNVSDEPMRELYGVDDFGEMPDWFTGYGKPSAAALEARDAKGGE